MWDPFHRAYLGDKKCYLLGEIPRICISAIADACKYASDLWSEEPMILDMF